MATYYVDVSAFSSGGFGGDPVFIVMNPSGTGYSNVSGSPILLNAGDTVGFKYTTYTNMSSIVVSLFSSDHFTSTTSLTLTGSYQYKTAKTAISLTVADQVKIRGVSSLGGGTTSNTKYAYYLGDSAQPDRTIDITNTAIEISTSAPSFNVAFTDTGSSTNSTITEYRVSDSLGDPHETRTGPGTITVTDTPANPGFPETYSIEARVTTANGGNGLYQPISSGTFTVTATTTAGSNDPDIDSYGMVIYDDNGTAVTSFTGGHTTLRTIFTGTTTLSTSTTTDIDTNLTGITSSNSIIMLEGDSGSGVSGVDRVPATFVNIGGSIKVRMGRHTVADTVKVTVAQYNGLTIDGTSATPYGWEINNGDDQVVLDDKSVTYGVKEVIDINTSLSTQQLFQNDECFFIYITLTQGTYPASAGMPIPALSCSKSISIIPPMLSTQKHTDGSHKVVLCYLAKGVATSNYKLAMLVSSDIATPEYYSGSADSYGIAVYNTSSDLVWHSGWRQAIVNNIINANQMTQGTTQNGTYDVTSGTDGVTAPVATSAEFNLSLNSTAGTKTVTGLNEMDPANSYVAGCAVSGRVTYYMGQWYEAESGLDEIYGGGRHRPSLKIESNTSAKLSMFRYGSGPTPPSTSDRGARLSTSFHPEGDYIIFRIV